MIATGINRAGEAPADLFGGVEKEARQGRLFETVDAINRKYGTVMLRISTSLPLERRERVERLRYPLFGVD